MTNRLMSMNYPITVVNYVIGNISLCEQNMTECGKRKKIPTKNKWEYCDIILLLPLLGVNHRQPLLHIPPKNVHINGTEERIDQFVIGYMVNPTLHV